MRCRIHATCRTANVAKAKLRKLRRKPTHKAVIIKCRVACINDIVTWVIYIVFTFIIQANVRVMHLLKQRGKGVVSLRDKANTRGFHALNFFLKIEVLGPIR